MRTPLLEARALSLPALSREGLSWRSVSPGKVEIAIDLANGSPEPTQEGDLVIEAAPLGAFVPSRPVARVAVGSLDPGERRRVKTLVSRQALNRAGFIPMGRAIGDFFKRLYGTTLDAAVIETMAQTEWIGNLNVYFDRCPERSVERHCAFRLRIAAGRPVGAMLLLPGQAECRVETSCTDGAWAADVLRPGDPLCLLLVRPPAEPGRQAGVKVSVTRLRDLRTVPVEFEFETVGGAGEKLGCIRV
jgi:hypothetical protein